MRAWMLICVVYFAQLARAFFPKSKFGSVLSGKTRQKSSVFDSTASLQKKYINSKLLPPMTQDELREMFREFNMTSFDFDEDPDLLKWAPNNEFFEKFGFVNSTERYSRQVMHVKTEFYKEYTTPILPQYKTFIADMMTVGHVQTVDARFKYDPLYAFGLCTQYYTIMKGYALQDEIDVIFNVLMKSLRLDAQKIRDDAKRILTLIKESSETEDQFLAQTEGELAEIFKHVRTNRFFKYTDAWGVGLGRLMELKGIEPNEASFKRWSANLRWVFAPRLMQSWSEFCGDQVKMQGVEAMQKQLLIREKKRAAERLETKAASFEGKKKALMELNLLIEERRQQLIAEAKEIKQRFDPDEFERISKSAV